MKILIFLSSFAEGFIGGNRVKYPSKYTFCSTKYQLKNTYYLKDKLGASISFDYFF